MLISRNSINTLSDEIKKNREVFCSGLFLSAKWFVLSQYDYDGIQLIVLPDKDSAEYCAADLYNLIEGDRVFFLPDSGRNLERRVQGRTGYKGGKRRRGLHLLGRGRPG